VETKTSAGSPAGVLKLPDIQAVLAQVQTLASKYPRFSAMIGQDVPTAQALEQLGGQLFQDRRFAEAASVFRSAVALTPENPATWTNYGTALDSAGSLDGAAACLEYSLALSHRQPDTWLLLGLVMKKKGDLAACEAAYRTCLEQKPDSSTAWQCLALLSSERKNYGQAIESFAAALKLEPTNSSIAANLGKLYYQVGRMPEACEAYQQAVRLDATNQHYRYMAGKTGFMRNILIGEPVESALSAYREQLASAESDTEKDRLELLHTSFGQLSGFGHIEAARRIGEKYLELQPNSTSMQYLMKALDREPSLERSPSAYIVEHFDEFSGSFDAKLVGVLGYDVPEKICSILREFISPGRSYDVLDAGCGTGLCGPLVRPFARELTGVDLSQKMLEQAAARGLYDRLICEELTSFLARSPGQFDLVVAADVIVYLGDLIPLFRAAMAIRPAGLFAFSTELWTGEKYRVQPSGRFAHERQYVRSIAAPCFVEHRCVETTIRLEGERRVPGSLFVFERRA
jgi:predicted TPR repeat methyltransferase